MLSLSNTFDTKVVSLHSQITVKKNRDMRNKVLYIPKEGYHCLELQNKVKEAIHRKFRHPHFYTQMSINQPRSCVMTEIEQVEVKVDVSSCVVID